MNLPQDILDKIEANFSDRNVVIEILNSLVNQRELLRVIRCILELSDSDYDAVDAWVKKANEDYRDIIWYAEYDNRKVRKYDFNYPFNEQTPYQVSD